MTEFFTRRLLPGAPWLHFVVIGALLHMGLAAAFPDPKPTLGPPSPVRLEQMALSFFRLSGSAPTEQDHSRLVDLALREQALFREALALDLHLADPAVEQRLIRNMRFVDPNTTSTDAELIARGLSLNLHLSDEVIRRRLIQVMEQLLLGEDALWQPSDSELRAAYVQQQDTLRQAAVVDFSHVFLGEVEATDAQAVLGTVTARQLSPEQALNEGKAFLSGYDFAQHDQSAVASRFGDAFALSLFDAASADPEPSPQWLAPIRSVFGMHLVYLRSFTSEQPLGFEQARAQLQRSLQNQHRQQRLDAAVTELLAKYEVRRS